MTKGKGGFSGAEPEMGSRSKVFSQVKAGVHGGLRDGVPSIVHKMLVLYTRTFSLERKC